MENLVFIFDFDGTFYTGKDIYTLIPTYINKHKRSFLPRISDKDYEKIIKENPTWNDIYVGMDLVSHIYRFIKKYPELDISIKDLRKWQLETIEPVVIDKKQTVNPEFMKKLCSKYPVYIVSNSDLIHIKHYMKEINIEFSWFKKIIGNLFTVKDPTKKHYYKNIQIKENISPQNVYVLGDSIKSDLEPALKLGMNTFHITNATKIPEIVNNILKSKKHTPI